MMHVLLSPLMFFSSYFSLSACQPSNIRQGQMLTLTKDMSRAKKMFHQRLRLSSDCFCIDRLVCRLVGVSFNQIKVNF